MKHIKPVNKKAIPARANIFTLISEALNKGAYLSILWNHDGSLDPEDIY
jgi:hypothetical protein